MPTAVGIILSLCSVSVLETCIGIKLIQSHVSSPMRCGLVYEFQVKYIRLTQDWDPVVVLSRFQSYGMHLLTPLCVPFPSSKERPGFHRWKTQIAKSQSAELGYQSKQAFR